MSWIPAPHPFDLKNEDPQHAGVVRPRALHLAPAWIPRPRRVAISEDEVAELPPRRVLIGEVPTRFRSAARGLYRIFNTAGYRFYWSNGAPPVAGSAPQATSSTLAYNTTATFADGTWHFSVSYFDGVLDSGFLPIGPHGENYLTLTISGGAVVPIAPTTPFSPALKVLAGGVVQVVGYYNTLPDGSNAADTWAIAYTINGTTPTIGSPNLTLGMAGVSPLKILKVNLPAQASGSVVKVQLQVRRTLTGGAFAYSPAGPVLSAVASTIGPSAPLSGGA